MNRAPRRSEDTPTWSSGLLWTTLTWLINHPVDFNVVVTENMFGDILSTRPPDQLAPGMPQRQPRRRHALRPSHDGADITGLRIGNPLAQILSVEMMLRYGFDWAGRRRHTPRGDHAVLDESWPPATSNSPRTPAAKLVRTRK
ncbi:MAG: isocitrate/isopropylmalate family dehydrogenase [Eggerthellaceae bacterium]